jgi:hypothetical protein
MKLRTMTVLTLFMLVLLTVSRSFAGDFGPAGIGIPGDTEDDNSCYKGGAWDGQCTTDYQWNAGWYHIRLIRGQIRYEQVPDMYKPAMPQPGKAQPSTGETEHHNPPPPPPTVIDTDGDGIDDSVDACPAVPGVPSSDPSQNGCPAQPPPPPPPPSIIDTDSDGIDDSVDACPAVPGVPSGDPSQNGCPAQPPPPPPPSVTDTDGDGIPDSVDACPNSQAPAGDLDGCPDQL